MGRLVTGLEVLSDSGRPAAFVEVHTDMPAAETFGQMRAWHGLVERIKQIPVPVLLQLASSGPVSPPDARTAKKIAQDLRRELLSDRPGTTFWTQGYTFLVMQDPGSEVAAKLGMHACFDPPSSRAGSVTAQRPDGWDHGEGPQVQEARCAVRRAAHCRGRCSPLHRSHAPAAR